MGLKKFTKRVRSTEIPVSPINIKTQFFKFLSGFLVTIRLIINSMEGIRITGPSSIINLAAL